MSNDDNPFLNDAHNADDNPQSIIESTDVDSKDDDEWRAILSGRENEDEDEDDDDDDITDQQRRDRKMKKVRILLLGVLLLAAIGFLGYSVITYIMDITGARSSTSTSATAKANTQHIGSAYTDSNGDTNPASASSISYLANTSGATTVNVNQRQIVVKSAVATNTMAVPGLQQDISAQACSLDDTATSCYIGSSKYNNEDVDVFSFRDAAQSSLLITSNHITRLSVQGTVLAYMQKKTFDTAQKNALILINGDQTGLLLVSDADMSPLVGTISVSSTSNK